MSKVERRKKALAEFKKAWENLLVEVLPECTPTEAASYFPEYFKITAHSIDETFMKYRIDAAICAICELDGKPTPKLTVVK